MRALRGTRRTHAHNIQTGDMLPGRRDNFTRDDTQEDAFVAPEGMLTSVELALYFL
jgi:hypothetical protein